MMLYLPCPPSLRDSAACDDVYRRDVASQCRGRQLAKKKKYRITAIFYGDWDNKDGSPRKRDIHNYWSKLADVLAAALGIDDSQFRPETFDAVHRPGKEYVTVEITG